jgi:phosphate-selective porin OprO/OprP
MPQLKPHLSAAAIVSVTCAFAFAPRLHAAEKELLDILLGNGAITQEQYEELLAKETLTEEDIASTNVTLDEGRSAVDGTELRRARMEMSGTFHDDWRWAAEADFADNNVAVKDFWLRYRGFEKVDLTFGHQKQPYSLDIEMSSNDIPFIERSIDAYLIAPFIDRAIGVRADASGEKWFAAAGIFGEAVSPGGIFGESSGIDPLVTGDEGWGSTGL